MATPPLAALHLQQQQPYDALGSADKILALQSMLNNQQMQPGREQLQQGQQQLQQGQIQLQQQQIQDRQTLQDIAPKYVKKNDQGQPTGFDYDGFSAEAQQKGVSPATMTQLATMQKTYAETVKARADAGQTTLSTQDKLNTDAYNHLEGIRGEDDPTKRQANWQAARSWALTSNVQGAQNLPLQAPDDKGLTGIEAQLGMHAQAVADAKATSDAQKATADAALAQVKAKLATGSKPGDFDALIDQITPPTGANAQLNARTKQMVNFSLQRGDIESAQKAIDAASSQVGAIEKETNPQVQAAKVQVATAEGAARANIEAQAARGSNAAVANVPPHLVGPASAAAAKAGEDYAQAKSVSDRLSEVMDAAKNGNVVSYQLIPQEGALQITTSQGVKRINMAEIQNYGGGSLWQRLQGHIGKQLTGKSIPDSVLNDMSEMQDIMARGTQAKYENDLKTINDTYGSTFKPVQMEPPKAKAATASKSQTGNLIYARDPQGKLHSAPAGTALPAGWKADKAPQ